MLGAHLLLCLLDGLQLVLKLQDCLLQRSILSLGLLSRLSLGVPLLQQERPSQGARERT